MDAIHLIDDRRMGGVTRFLDRVTELRPDDRTEFVRRGTMRARAYPAQHVVSHLAISWRSLPMLIALRASNPKARLIHVEHSYCEGFERHRVSRQGRFRALLRAAYGLFDEVICVSEGQAAWMHEARLTPPVKLRIAPPLVDLSPFLAVEPSRPGPFRRFGYVGRLDEQKGIDTVVKAWCERPPKDATLEIFGDGPLREMLEEMAAGTAEIRFHGRTETPAEAYRHFDVALMPSRWEPYGLSCLEARAAGRPVLAARVDGLPEQLRDGGGKVMTGGEGAWGPALGDMALWDSLSGEAIAGRRTAKRDASASLAFWRSFSEPQEAGALDAAGSPLGKMA